MLPHLVMEQGGLTGGEEDGIGRVMVQLLTGALECLSGSGGEGGVAKGSDALFLQLGQWHCVILILLLLLLSAAAVLLLHHTATGCEMMGGRSISGSWLILFV